MRVVVDANILTFIYGANSWRQLATFLVQCEMVLVTIESVYRRELPDPVRANVDQLLARDLFALVTDPDRLSQQPKNMRKLRKSITRKARCCPPTSGEDQQLLFVAMRDDVPLVTDEQPLQQLAHSCNAPRCYDFLDVIDALYAAGVLSEKDRQNVLSDNPGGRQFPSKALQKELEERGGFERFECND